MCHNYRQKHNQCNWKNWEDFKLEGSEHTDFFKGSIQWGNKKQRINRNVHQQQWNIIINWNFFSFFLLILLFCFETGCHISQAGLQLATRLRMTLNFWYYCSVSQRCACWLAGITGVHPTSPVYAYFFVYWDGYSLCSPSWHKTHKSYPASAFVCWDYKCAHHANKYFRAASVYWISSSVLHISKLTNKINSNKITF